MKRLLLVGAALAAVFSFSACTPPLDHGTVTAKYYTPYKHWTTQGGYAYTCLPGFDGKMNCAYKYSAFVIEDHYQQECYELDFEADGRSGDACVAPEEYSATQVGDLWGAP